MQRLVLADLVDHRASRAEALEAGLHRQAPRCPNHGPVPAAQRLVEGVLARWAAVAGAGGGAHLAARVEELFLEASMLEAVRTGQVRGRAALRLAVTEPRSRARARAPQRGRVLRLSWGTSVRSCTAPVTDIISYYAWSRRRSVSQKILSKTLEHNAGWSQAAAVWLCAHKVPGACRMSTPCRCARSRSRTPPAQAANPRAVVEDILARASLLSAELGSLDPARPASAARSTGAPGRQGTGEGSPARPAGASAAAQEPRAGTCLPGPVSSSSSVEAAPAQAAPRRPGARTALGPASSLPADSHTSVEQPVRGACDGHAQGVGPAGFPPTCTTAAPPCSPRSSSTCARGGGRAAGSVQQARTERPVAGGIAEGGLPRGGGCTAQSAARQPAGRAGPERAEADGGGGAAQEAAARPGGRDAREAAAAALDAFAAKLGRHASELQPRTRQARLGPVIPVPHELLSHSFAAAECVSAAVRARLDSQLPMRRRPLRRPTCCLGSCCSSQKPPVSYMPPRLALRATAAARRAAAALGAYASHW